MTTLAKLESNLRTGEEPVFFADIDLALAEDVTKLVEQACRLRLELRERSMTRMAKEYFRTPPGEE